ncbi:PREDICTED: succinate--CoA ligase [GDP-forming] subunit beta, mitochondrial-like isoform X2 [Amphimedon queenslandica]|uniref:Succinate--CoA ligase [GDP-forming] subunit beta, mitochondrial n=1 Tax=Amphimedon queenslandica TaxID=400682 RepID=A0A1X7UW62_AMPQE|nr:PREDICTED: succinate--CoA ligase [GDP-forming] subunit beta, mitochondrial-like isoform X2 [Amphimedon queenslandica]|eukprot:XP_019851953.1 PREDICTED: succinate--CoA ligase [GDP-forming] subunit beta, mitochondrial-like isoform X2 [Amphimedon queenslandica]
MAAFRLPQKCLPFLFTRSQGPLLQARSLNLHEYQSKDLMLNYGVTIQKFQTADTPERAGAAAKELGVPEVVLKAQILAGGRGKGRFSSGLVGGVKVTRDLESIEGLARDMINHRLVTKQTNSNGVEVKKVMVAEALDIARETYLAILMDPATQGPVLVGSPDGGVDIEEIAEKNPERIFKIPVDIMKGITMDQALLMAKNLEFKDGLRDTAATQIMKLYDLFCGVDATQVEINPFGETPDGRVVCFDAKVNFDDTAKYRQKEIFSREDTSEKDEREVEATLHNLNYIGMNGNIGCLVNGAGLAMATMDIIKLHKGEPANFLDVGGAVNESQVLSAFKLLTADPQVRAILVNVFGGIVSCATIASGIIAACKEMELHIPLIVRLEGSNVDKARSLLEDSDLPIIPAKDLSDAAAKAVASLT